MKTNSGIDIKKVLERKNNNITEPILDETSGDNTDKNGARYSILGA